MDILLLGAPGAGKGTQAALLSEWADIPTVSTGVLFRNAIEQETDLGKYAVSFIDRGALVPDETTIALVRERLSESDCAEGVILDGFPRTVAQAEAFAEMLKDMGRSLGFAAYIRVNQDVLLDRLSGRWFCSNCGATYHHVFSPEAVEGVCDNCTRPLERRSDDEPAVQNRRIKVYEEATEPLIEYYRATGALRTIDGNRDIEAIQADLRALLLNAQNARYDK